MRHRTASKPAVWGLAAVATLIALIVLCAVISAGLAVVWIRGTYDVGALAHTLTLLLVLAAIAAVICFMARKVRALVRSYRRHP
jgi:hypothetical protein